MQKYFGTDGIRGQVGLPPISADFFLKLGWAAGLVLAGNKNSSKKSLQNTKVLIGKDTRVSGYLFESALQAGLISAGVDTFLLGPMPTPGIAYLTRALRASAGIVISASHNPYTDNGIKFFSSEGMKLPDNLELEIEAKLEETFTTVDSRFLGKAQRVKDAEGRYIEFCKNTFPHDLDLKGLKIILDCANGATYHIAPAIFRELGAEVIEMACKPDGYNINEKCGATHPQPLSERVVSEKCDLGIAFDGDGDRVIMVDHTGAIVDGDELLFIIARGYAESLHLKGGVVGTLMSNYGLELAFKEMQIPFLRSKVGDRYVLELLKKENWNLGGESSGHIICLDANTTGDGIVSALKVLAVTRLKGRTLYELKQGMHKFPQSLINVPLKNSNQILEKPEVKSAVSKIESTLKGKGRVLLRPSGTEPVVRVMVEGQDPQLVEQLAQDLAQVIEKSS